MQKRMVLFAKPDITNQEIEKVKEVLLSGWLTTGKVTETFENQIKKYCDVPYSVVVNSATAGLHLGLRALDVKKGESVIVPALTFTATAEVVFRCNAIPLLVDVDRNSYLLTKKNIEDFIDQFCIFRDGKLIHIATNTRVRGIICVHYGGRVCDLDSLKSIAHQYHLFLAEDAAHAFGSEYKNQKIGKFSDFCVFSFYATKNLTTAEGGALVTTSRTIAKKVKTMRLHGFDIETYKRKNADYDVVFEGYKYNLPDVLSAIGIAQLKRYEQMLQKRKEIFFQYQKNFQDLEGLILSPEMTGNSYHLYTIETDLRDLFIKELKKMGIQTGIHFKPLYRMSYYKNKNLYHWKNFPNTEEIYKRIFSLPIYSAMSEEDILYVISSVRTVYENLYSKKFQRKIALLSHLHKSGSR